MLDCHIRSNYFSASISRALHAYTKGWSTYTLLSALMECEKALFQKLYSMATLIDVEGAFNSVKTEYVVESLRNRNISDFILIFIS